MVIVAGQLGSSVPGLAVSTGDASGRLGDAEAVGGADGWLASAPTLPMRIA